MGSMIQKIIAIFLVFMLQGSFIQATFYSPYDFNRHLAHFQRKNYQFWHELYRSNYQVPPFLRYSQPGFIHSGPLHKMHALDGMPMMPPPPQFNNQHPLPNMNNNNNEQQWNALNDVYGNGYQQEVPRPMQGINDESSDATSTTTTLFPPTKRTTRPRTTYTTRERTTVSLSTEAVTKPTSEMGAESTTEATTTPKPKPSRKPSSELIAQLAQINNSSQGVLSQLGKPASKPTGKRPSASQLLQQIQKVNSSAQNLLSTLKPSVKFQGYELNKEIWTTARTTEATEEEIPVVTELQEVVPLVAPAIVIEDRETPSESTISRKDENSEKLVLVSTSKGSEENIESRNSDSIMAETTEMPEEEKTTTDPMPEDMNELDNRHEEYDLGSSEDESLELTPIDGKRRFDEDITTAEFEEDMTTTENSIMEKAPENDEELPFEEDKTEATTLSDDSDATTTLSPSESSEEEEDVDQELIQFIIIDIATSAAALQSVITNILDPLGLGLRPEFTLLESLLADIRKEGKTTPEDAEKVSTQIAKITSNFGLKRLRSTQILEHTQRLNKLGKLLKLSVSNM